MPVEYLIDPARRLVVTTAYDRVTFADFNSAQQRMVNDPAFRAEYDQLVDGTRTTSLEISIDEVQMLTRRRAFSPESKRAFVASNPAHFGVGRMAEIYHELSNTASHIRVFYDLDAAMEWLNAK